MKPVFHPQDGINEVWWCTPVNPALGRWNQEDEKVKVTWLLGELQAILWYRRSPFLGQGSWGSMDKVLGAHTGGTRTRVYPNVNINPHTQ